MEETIVRINFGTQAKKIKSFLSIYPLQDTCQLNFEPTGFNISLKNESGNQKLEFGFNKIGLDKEYYCAKPIQVQLNIWHLHQRLRRRKFLFEVKMTGSTKHIYINKSEMLDIFKIIDIEPKNNDKKYDNDTETKDNDVLLKLSNKPDRNGMVYFILNRTKLNYVNLGGIDHEDTRDCVIDFIFSYGIWDKSDYIFVIKQHIGYTLPGFDNISFVLRFYNEAAKSSGNNQKIIKAIDDKQTTVQKNGEMYRSFVKKIMDQLDVDEPTAKKYRSALEINLEKINPELKKRENDAVKIKELDAIISDKEKLTRVLNSIEDINYINELISQIGKEKKKITRYLSDEMTD